MVSNRSKGWGIILLTLAGVIGAGLYYFGYHPIVPIAIAVSLAITWLISKGIELMDKPDSPTDDQAQTACLTEMVARSSIMDEIVPPAPGRLVDKVAAHIVPPVPDYELPGFTDGNGNWVRGCYQPTVDNLTNLPGGDGLPGDHFVKPGKSGDGEPGNAVHPYGYDTAYHPVIPKLQELELPVRKGGPLSGSPWRRK